MIFSKHLINKKFGNILMPINKVIRYAATETMINKNQMNNNVWSNAKPFMEIPSEPSLPIIGNDWIFLPIIGKYKITEMHKMFDSLYRKYGSIVRLNVQKQNAVIIYDPNDIETMYRNDGKYPLRHSFFSLKHYRELNTKHYKNAGLSVINGKEWGDIRSKVQPYLMKPKLISNYLPQMNVAANEFVTKMAKIRDKNNEINDYLNELYIWALESLGMIILDTKLGLINKTGDNYIKGQALLKNIVAILEQIWKLEFAIFPKLEYTSINPVWRRFAKSNDEFTQILIEFISASMKRIESGDLPEEPSILQQLLSRPDFDVKDAVSMTADIISAGIDTTSHTIGFLLYHLAKNPKVQEKLFQEINTVIGNNTEITATMINQLKYLKACLKESFRITPTVNDNLRTNTTDVIFQGYQIPSDTIIYAANYIPCREEKHFPDPLSFKPERWLKDSKSDAHPFIVIPFGFGPRMCIGRRIAEQEIWLLICKIIQKFKVQYNYDDIGIKVKVVNVPDKPLRFSFVERKE